VGRGGGAAVLAGGSLTGKSDVCPANGGVAGVGVGGGAGLQPEISSTPARAHHAIFRLPMPGSVVFIRSSVIL
jgi:hypothetical protein